MWILVIIIYEISEQWQDTKISQISCFRTFGTVTWMRKEKCWAQKPKQDLRKIGCGPLLCNLKFPWEFLKEPSDARLQTRPKREAKEKRECRTHQAQSLFWKRDPCLSAIKLLVGCLGFQRQMREQWYQTAAPINILWFENRFEFWLGNRETENEDENSKWNKNVGDQKERSSSLMITCCVIMCQRILRSCWKTLNWRRIILRTGNTRSTRWEQ